MKAITALGWQYWTFRLALALASCLPRRLGYWLGALGGELYFRLNPQHSGKAVDNYAVLLADERDTPRVRATARRSFRNYGKYLFDFLRQSSLDPDQIEHGVSTSGFDHLDAALAGGRGAVLAVAHFGNWDLAGALLAQRGYPFFTLVDTFAPPALDRLVHATRNRFGLGLIPVDQPGALRHVQRALRGNQVVGVVFDRPQRDGGVAVEFFGAPAWLPAGPARLALRSGAPVLTAYLLRRPGDRTYLGVIEPPVPFSPTGDEQTDVQALTQAIVRRLEALLRQHPDQWYMFRRMWPDQQSHARVPSVRPGS